MKIISNLDLIKDKYRYLRFPNVKSKKNIIIKKVKASSCLARNSEREYSRSAEIDCSDIECRNCFFCKAEIKDMENYINILKIK